MSNPESAPSPSEVRNAVRAMLVRKGKMGVLFHYGAEAETLNPMIAAFSRLIELTEDLVCKQVLAGVMACLKYPDARHSLTVDDIPADLPGATFVHHIHLPNNTGQHVHRASMVICMDQPEATQEYVYGRYRIVGNDVCVDHVVLPSGAVRVDASAWGAGASSAQ